MREIMLDFLRLPRRTQLDLLADLCNVIQRTVAEMAVLQKETH